jgi:hypothetical protein
MLSEPYMEIRNLRGLTVGRPAVELVRWAAGALAGSLLLLAAGVLCWRSMAGALNSPLEPVPLMIVGVATAAGAATVRACWGRGFARFNSNRLLVAGISAIVLAVGVVLSLPGSSTVGLTAFWCLLIAGECWAWLPLKGRLSIWRSSSETMPTAGRTIRVDSAETPFPHVVDALAEPPNRDVTQQLVRSRATDGSEELAGWIRVGLTPGQRFASVHLAFCPPFPRTPELSVEQLEGPEGKLKTVQLLPYGTRFDLKLAHTLEEPATVLLRFSARLKGEAEVE